MKAKRVHIDVVKKENPMRMGFYIPGYGVVMKTNKAVIATNKK